MNIRIKTTNISMSPALSEYVDKRLDKIVKLVGADPAIMCDVELARTTNHHNKAEDLFRAELHITGPGLDAYASAENADLYQAIGQAKEEAIRELRGTKGKRISLVRRSGARVKAMVRGMWPFGK